MANTVAIHNIIISLTMKEKNAFIKRELKNNIGSETLLLVACLIYHNRLCQSGS